MRPHIENYSSYRSYLRDIYFYSKDKSDIVSFQFVASRMKTSRSYLKLIIDKKRHMSIDKIPLLCRLFELDNFERMYLTFLVLENVSSNEDSSIFFQDILQTLKKRKNMLSEMNKFLDDAHFYLFSDWLSLVLHSMVDLENFSGDSSWIFENIFQSHLTSPQQISDKLNRLLELGVIKKSGDDFWSERERVSHIPREIDWDQQKIFEVGARLALENLKGESGRPAHFQLEVFSLNEEDFGEVRELYKEFKENLMKIAHKSKQRKAPNKVFWASNSIFAITK